MEGWAGKVALVTGASSGIGVAIAVSLVQNGMIVIGVARNIDKIQALAKELESSSGKLIAMKCDVCEESDIMSVFSAVKSQFGGIDVCVNNAGLAYNAPLLTGETKDWRTMLETNVLGPCIITREFMSQLKERGVDNGHVFLINSIVGHKIPSLVSRHFYSGTKFAVTAIAEGLRQELREIKSNCRVTSVSPGLVKTEFLGRSIRSDDIEGSKKKYDSLVYNGQVLEAEDIASAIVFVLSAPPRMEVNEILIRPTAQVF